MDSLEITDLDECVISVSLESADKNGNHKSLSNSVSQNSVEFNFIL